MERLVLLSWFVLRCGAVRDEDFMEYIHINTDLQAKYQVMSVVKYVTTVCLKIIFRHLIEDSSIYSQCKIKISSEHRYSLIF